MNICDDFKIGLNCIILDSELIMNCISFLTQSLDLNFDLGGDGAAAAADATKYSLSLSVCVCACAHQLYQNIWMDLVINLLYCACCWRSSLHKVVNKLPSCLVFFS